MKIEFKEKHICFVVRHLATIVAGEHFKLLAEIRDKVKDNNLQPDDFVEVDVNKETLLNIYIEIGHKPEYLVAGINAAMKEILSTQFTEKITAYYTVLGLIGEAEPNEEEQVIINEGADALYIVERITERTAEANNQIEQMIQAGRDLIS